jgi:transcriptional regulator with XRE-family HTH domain
MSMKSNNEDIEALFLALDDNKSEIDLIKEDSYVLQANYLSEIERFSKIYGFNKKDIADKIGISGSYLTQVFNGDKPLNFITIAKIKRALNIRFNITASLVTEKKTEINNEIPFVKHKLNTGYTQMKVVTGDKIFEQSDISYKQLA